MTLLDQTDDGMPPHPGAPRSRHRTQRRVEQQQRQPGLFERANAAPTVTATTPSTAAPAAPSVDVFERRTDARRPTPILAMHKRERVSGEPFLVAIVGERIVLEPGTELHLRRLHDDGEMPSPEFALMVIQPRERWQPTNAERERVAGDRLDGSAVRRDARDEGEHVEPAPW